MRLICVSYACHMRVVCVTRILRVVVCVTFLCRPHLLLGLPRGEGRRIGGGSVAFGGGGSSEETPHPLQRAHASLRAPSFEREGPHPPQEKKGGKNTCGGMYIWEASGSVAYGKISDLIWIDSKRKTPPYSHRPHRRFSVLASRVWRRGRHAAARR